MNYLRHAANLKISCGMLKVLIMNRIDCEGKRFWSISIYPSKCVLVALTAIF